MAHNISVTVTPDAQDFFRDLAAQILPQVDPLGAEIADRLSARISERIRTAIAEGLGEGAAGAGAAGGASGDDFADTFDRTVRTKLAAALRTLPRAVIDIDGVPAEQTIDSIRARMQELRATIEVNVDDLAANQELDRLRLNLVRSELQEYTAHIGVDVNDREAIAQIEKFRVQLDALAARSPDIRVRVDAGAASAQLAALRAQMTGLKADAAGAAGAGGMGLLISAAVAVGTSLIPIGAIAGVAMGALVIGAASAILGFKGIQDQIKQNTALGQTYQAGLLGLNTEFTTLKTIAAQGLLGGFTSAIKEITPMFPTLNLAIGQFSRIVGDVLAHVIAGLVHGLQALMPEFVQVGKGIDAIAAGFARWSAGGGLASFAAYARQVLPQVGATLASLAAAIGKVIVALAPMGGVVLGIIKGFADAINAIPVSVIDDLAPALVIAAVAVQGFGASAEGALGPVGLLIAALVTAYTLSNSSFTGAKGDSFLGVQRVGDYKGQQQDPASPQKGPSIWSQIANLGTQDGFGGNGDPNRKVFDAQAKVLAAQITAAVDSAVAQARPIAQAKINTILSGIKLGGTLAGTQTSLTSVTTSLQSYIDAAHALDGVGAGNQTTIKGVKYQTDEYNKALILTNGNVAAAVALMQQNAAMAVIYGASLADVQKEQLLVNDAVDAAAAKYHLSTDQVSQYAADIGLTAEALTSGKITSAQFTAAIGVVSTAMQTANTSQVAWTDAVTKFSASTQDAGDKAALLGAALQAYRGYALDFATANLQGSVAVTAAGEAMKTYSASVSSTGVLLGQMVQVGDKYVQQSPKLTAGSLAIADALTKQATTAQMAAQETYQNEMATKGSAVAAQDAVGVYLGYRQSLIDTAIQSGLTAAQAQGLADKYLAVPKDVDTFVKQFGATDVNTSIQALTTAILGLNGTLATIYMNGDNSNALHAIQVVQDKMNSINGNVVTVRVDMVTNDTGVYQNGVLIAGHAYGGAYAAGGVLPGYNPGVDSLVARFSPGEGILVPEAVRALGGPRGIYDINRHYAPRVSGHTGTYAFAVGGVPNVPASPSPSRPSGGETTNNWNITTPADPVATAHAVVRRQQMLIA